MKLAEALILRADMNKKIASLTERINGNCKVQEGEEPGEDPQELLIDTFRILQEHEQLVCKINLANVTIKLPNGKTMMEALAERDRIAKQHAILKAAAASSRNQLHNYYSNSEIKWKSVMKVDGLEKQADDVSKKLRELNTAIQAANWNGDIPD
jgi:hypothetical protein